MTVSNNIQNYIENSKINGQLARWKKSVVNVFITSISAPITSKEFYYSEINRAMILWNNILKTQNINLFFQQTQVAENADIIVHWTKVGRVFEGMCKYLSVINGEIRKISIEIGLKNELSPKETTDESIFFAIMHEFGHSLGLGHGIEINDLMYVPHQKNIHKPSANDLYVLNMIYSN